ncbi:MAG: MvaI/BcnI family restriction endonuclease [Bacteroides sp.]|nr:MvaI/BcnI family restriction endonuclease [Prevotella sp.]MCM1407821.1 MvaI/BcnI family restriction endonuclease [Treponema brennaborense]MCM1470874.1 MvaI/BcnI family restriction endonuclease [Bacteroides sp.]
MGWIETHRSGRTGIGKTLEDLLGIEENNRNEPDFANYELKAMRTNGGDTQLLTLLTKSPLPQGVNSKLLEMYGYISDVYAHKNKVLHSTLSAGHFAQVSGTGKSLGIDCRDEKIAIIDNEGNSFAYWTEETLNDAFKKKYPYSMIHVYADSQFGERKEEFYFHTAYELSEFSFEKLLVQLREGKVKIDIRIGQHKNGKTHDHGTGFRIQDRALTEIFLNKKCLVKID